MDLITITQVEGTHFQAAVRKHIFLSDMAVNDGGSDQAPAPAELLVSALGACIGMTINLYCQSHGYNSDNIELALTYLLENNPKRIKTITIDVELPKEFPADRKQAIFHAVKSCVIYNSLHPDIEIDIEIED